jgi:BCD family chlorophyll transporter-like MFS transporter
MTIKPLSWLGIIKLGLVQCALGAVTAVSISTLNRVMVVEIAMPAVVPAALVAWQYLIQMTRPHWGFGSDRGNRRTPWIIGGMGVVAMGAVIAPDAALMMKGSPFGGILLGLVAYSMIGAGVGAAGTSLLALLATRVAPTRRPAAASITWVMMIFGIVVSSGVAGHFLQPFSPQRLAIVVSTVAGLAFLLTLLAVWGAEGDQPAVSAESAPSAKPAAGAFRAAISDLWADRVARRFTIFVFVSMLAYSAQELILEPFAGLVFHMSPKASAQLSGLQHGGVLLGMILVGVLGARLGGKTRTWMRSWVVAGCVGSALALGGMGAACLVGPSWPLAPTVFVLGLGNGVFAVAAIGSMMALAGGGREAGGQAGVRMGVWGAAQAVAFAFGGFLGALGVDVLRSALHVPATAFLFVFGMEAIVFLVSAWIGGSLEAAPRSKSRSSGAAVTVEFSGAM